MSEGDAARDSRSELEREADVARARLLNTIEQLDQRRHDALDWRLQARRHSGELAVLASALALTIGVPVGVAVYRASTRDARLRKERIRALTRFWEHPERVAAKRKHKVGWLLTALVAAVAGTAATAALGQQKLSERKWPRFPAPPVDPLGL
jgi:hypothetical protein